MAISSEMGAAGSARQRSSHRGMAFLVEALVVLAFLMLALAVFVNLFSSAQLEALRANHTSEAIMIATNCAEEFSASPLGVEEEYEDDGFVVSCKVSPIPHDAGTLYEATIVVSRDGRDLYTLHTSRYVSDDDPLAGGEAA